MELTARYGLEFNPFLKNSKQILYAGSEYKEALFRLNYLSGVKGFGLLTGAPGRGKTTVVRSWSEKLNPSLFKVIYTSLSTVTVNEFYRKKIQEYKSDYIPSLADYYGSIRRSVTVKISYEITCNNDEFFSVLIRRTEDDGDEISESWEGNTFSRSSDMIGSLTSVPHLLGILDYGESDEWLEDRQSRKVADALCTLILEAIQNNHGDIDYYPDLKAEDLEDIIDPVFSLDHDFWMDEEGNLVFFILPGRIAPADAGLITFTFTLEELRDEL